ncbi:MAG: glycosyltransferase [Ignavibacteriae bacterium]|nr:glycosyltransferase [Ignavibacteriota bacterium]
MEKNKFKDLWRFKRSAGVDLIHKYILLILITGGTVSILYFADWWFRTEHIKSLWLFVILSATFWWSMARLILTWINYLRISNPDPVKAPEGLSVAVFTTSSPGEPLSMFEKTLAACRDITYPHTTYLLDDTKDIRFKEAAERNGAVWLELVGLPGAKAGKVNAALKLTKEDFILILDPDHIPFPNFLDNTLGFFNDEKVGFVQVSQAYYNQYRSFTAKGAAEQTYTFYGPTQMGLNGFGCSVAIGANCTFRRKALESIGGHGIGLAEDLITSIRIHSKGWKSVFNPVIVSRGLVPEDFGSFCKQQIKWARGVFEVTFVELPRLFKGLTFWQRISYFMIGTYYFVGAIQMFFTLIPFVFFLTGILPADMSFAEFVIRGSFVAFFGIVIYLYVQRWMCDPETERGIHWRGMVLKYAAWPVYLIGFLLAIVNADIPYIPTAKKAVTGYFTPFARPLVVHAFLFLVTVFSVLAYRKYWVPESELILTSEKTWSMIGFAFIAFMMSAGGIYAALEARNLTVEEPWENVNLNEIKINEDEK